ncbi:MAG: LysR family transcriptional regulator [Chloroflexota bacterium]|nr:LysR family transcriptional regulator [Chloroflexota bacterium]MDE2886053.1 LysR family transcriptional regulator [Chloroflexota bacterium]
MDVGALRSFVAVCRSGSFREAARERHVSQPGVSRHVQRLETELGVDLLVRHRKRIMPTAAGSRLFAYAVDTLAAHDRIVESLARDDATVEGELRIAASTAPGEYLLPRLLSQFTEIYPRVRPRVAVTDSASATAQVAEGDAALGFVGMRAAAPSLQWTVVAEDELVLAVPGRHPFAGRASVDVTELKGLPFIEREPGSGTWTGLHRALDRAGIKDPGYTPVMVVNSTHATLAAVNNGFGFSIVSSLAVHEHEFDQVYPARLTGLDTVRSLYMVRRTSMDSSVAEAFGDWVLARLAGGSKTTEERLLR